MLQVALSPCHAALAVPCLLAVVWVAMRLRLVYRIRQNPGVRAPVLSNNPFGVIYFFLETAYMQVNNRLIAYFDSIFTRFVSPSSRCPHVAELSLLSRRIIITREPEHVKTVLTSKFARFGKGPNFHAAWSPFLGDSIFTTDGALWQRSRALIRPMFTRERVRDLDIFDRWTTRLLAHLPAESGQTVDMCDLFYRMTLDVTTDFLLGEHVGALDNPDSEFTHAFTEVQRMQMILTILA